MTELLNTHTTLVNKHVDQTRGLVKRYNDYLNSYITALGLQARDIEDRLDVRVEIINKYDMIINYHKVTILLDNIGNNSGDTNVQCSIDGGRFFSLKPSWVLSVSKHNVTALGKYWNEYKSLIKLSKNWFNEEVALLPLSELQRIAVVKDKLDESCD